MQYGLTFRFNNREVTHLCLALFPVGGGKDRVELFIERAKKNVITSRNSLKTVIDILELDTSSVTLGKNGKY